MNLIDYESYQELIKGNRVTNSGLLLSDLEVMDMRIKIDIADSLAELVEQGKPKWITLTCIEAHIGEECHVPVEGLYYGYSLNSDKQCEGSWIVASNGWESLVSETPAEIKFLITAALESDKDKAGEDKN